MECFPNSLYRAPHFKEINIISYCHNHQFLFIKYNDDNLLKLNPNTKTHPKQPILIFTDIKMICYSRNFLQKSKTYLNFFKCSLIFKFLRQES